MSIRTILWLAILALVVGTSAAQTPTPQPLVEALSLKPGDPLSARALVQRPPPVRGLVSWSIETKRHRGHVHVAALSPDEKLLATGGLDGITRIWNTATGEFVRALAGHEYYVYGISWSPDGKYLATTGTYDYTAKIWSTDKWQPLRAFKGHEGHTHQVAWAPDGKTIAVGGGYPSGYIYFWDVTQAEPIKKNGVGGYIYDLQWTYAGGKLRLAAATTKQSAAIYDGTTGEFQSNFILPEATAYAVSWSPDGTRLIAGGIDKTVIFDVDKNEAVLTMDKAKTTRTSRWSPDGKTIALNTTAATLFLEEPYDYDKPVASAPIAATTILWESDSSHVWLVDATRAIRWNHADKKIALEIDLGGIQATQWDPGKSVLTNVGAPKIEMFDPATGKRKATLEHASSTTVAAWSPDGKRLATGGYDKVVSIWSADGTIEKKLEGHEGTVLCLAWANTKTLASGSADKTVRVWDMTSEKVRVLKAGDSVAAVDFGKDAKTIVAGGVTKDLWFWTGTGDFPSLTLPFAAVKSIAFAPNGKQFAVGRVDGHTDILTYPKPEVVQTYESVYCANSVAWSPDSTGVLKGDVNHQFHLFMAGSSKPVYSPIGMSNIWQVGWTADGKLTIVGGQNRCVRVYSAADAALQGVIVAGKEQSEVISADGHFRSSDDSTSELVYIAQTPAGQETLSPMEFAAKFKWKNQPKEAKLPTK